MKRVERILAGAALLGALLSAWPGSAATPTPTVTPTVTPTPTPTLTPTATPTPLTVSANAVYTLCSISSGSSVCGRIRKAASQSTTAAYLFQVTASGARFDIWVSCDNASGGSTRTAKRSLQYVSESYSLPVSEVGPCTVGVTPIWASGTGVLVASITGDHTMLALPTPGP